ncbi:MAG: lysophospholipid acyltransferase family protein [Phycisphaerales bacterium]
MLIQPKKRRKGIPPILHGPVFSAVRAVAGLTQIAGIENSARVIRGLGAAYALSPINAKRLIKAKESLAWCFPQFDADRVHETAVESFRHLFSLAAELTWTPRCITEDAYPFHIEMGELSTGLSAMLADGPAVLVAGHCGNWELLGALMARLGFPIHAIYRPLDMKPLDDWMYATRSAMGLTLVSKFGASQEFDDLMHRGVPLAFIADQNAGDRGLFVPFFGRLASSYKAVALLAMRHNAPVVCGHAMRVRGDQPGASAAADFSREFRYHISVPDVIRPDDWADQPDPAFYITARYRRAIETMVRAAPEQYLWMHRAWKSRPPHERADRAPGPFPAKLREKLEQLPWMTQAELDRIVARSERDATEGRQVNRP